MLLRLALTVVVAGTAVATTGCGTLFPQRRVMTTASNACPPAECVTTTPAPATTREVVAPAPTTTTTTTREVATPRPAEAPVRTREVVERQVERQVERETTVTQDMLLIPRTVYMPYMPHTPTAPARVRSADLQNNVYADERGLVRDAPGLREAGAPREAAGMRDPGTTREVASPRPAGDERLVDALDKCAQMMTKMDQRLSDLESRAVNGLPGPPGPQGPPGMPGPVVNCPIPVVVPAPAPPARRLFNKLCPPAIEACPPLPLCPQ